MRIIGLDVHRSFAEVAILDRGAIRLAGRILLEHGRIIEFGKTSVETIRASRGCCSRMSDSACPIAVATLARPAAQCSRAARRRG